MSLSDKADNTLTLLRNTIWLHNDAEIAQVCKEVAAYLEQLLSDRAWRQTAHEEAA